MRHDDMRITPRSRRRIASLALALALAPAAVAVPSAVAATNNIFIVAGTGNPGALGDTGPAIAAELNRPSGVAATADGGFLLSDWDANRIRRVSAAGITTVAGSGGGGFSGDGGPSDAALLAEPQDVAATADGGFLIADRGNHRVRFVDADLRPPAGDPPAEDPPAGDPPALPGKQDTPQQDVPATQPGPALSRFALALSARRLRARPRRRLTVGFTVTGAASVRLTVLRGGRRIARVSRRARPGRNGIRLRAPRRAGRYRLMLTASTFDGRRGTARAVLTVTRSRGRR